MHELAHLVHFDHSSSFWDLVEEMEPNYKVAYSWLKKYERTLPKLNLERDLD